MNNFPHPKGGLAHPYSCNPMNNHMIHNQNRAGMPTFASLFSGFGGADLGAIAAGLKPIWAIEYEADIAAVYRQNLGDHITVADILDCDPADFERPEILHASPPCPNFSNAKAGAEETPHDIALAEKVAEFVTVLLPEKFTLENVYQYRNSQSWGIIAQALLTHGYQFNYWHCNMADYGVPQTRKRMIAIARRDGIKPMLPPATHAEKPQAGLFGTLKPWVGWYEAIEDLIPSLPESKFADWQLKRLPPEFRESWLCEVANGTGGADRWGSEPSQSILAQGGGRIYRAYIAPINGEATNGFYENEPAQTIAANHGAGKYRAFIVDDGNGKDGTVKSHDEPMGTVRTLNGGGALSRAFIVMSNATSLERAYEGQGVLSIECPANTVMQGNNNSDHRASVGGRIVQMTPRALARFQSFPDSYILPDSKKLACTGLGNAEPPLFAQRKFESLT